MLLVTETLSLSLATEFKNTLVFEILTVEKFFFKIVFGLLGVPKLDIPMVLGLTAELLAERILLFIRDLKPELIFLLELKAALKGLLLIFRGVSNGLESTGASPFWLLSKEILR